MYTPCGDCEADKTAFHWRTVACSYECGKIYLARVMEARENKEKDITLKKDDVEIKPRKKQIYKAKNNEESEQIE